MKKSERIAELVQGLGVRDSDEIDSRIISPLLQKLSDEGFIAKTHAAISVTQHELSRGAENPRR